MTTDYVQTLSTTTLLDSISETDAGSAGPRNQDDLNTSAQTIATATTSGIRTSSAMRIEDQLAGQHYRFEHLTLPLILRDLRFGAHDPGPGDLVPEFDLPTLSGGRFRARDLAQNGPTLLIFGSITCPVTDNAAPGLNDLYQRFGNRIHFIMVNVREAHPGRAFPQPKTFDAKVAHAERLRDLHQFEFDVAVDDLSGSLHRALSPKPNSAYLLGSDRRILFRAQWANDTNALVAAMDTVVARRMPHPSESGGVVTFMLHMIANVAPVLDRAGGGAWADMWRAAPPVAAIAFALKSLHIRPQHP